MYWRRSFLFSVRTFEPGWLGPRTRASELAMLRATANSFRWIYHAEAESTNGRRAKDTIKADTHIAASFQCNSRQCSRGSFSELQRSIERVSF